MANLEKGNSDEHSSDHKKAHSPTARAAFVAVIQKTANLSVQRGSLQKKDSKKNGKNEEKDGISSFLCSFTPRCTRQMQLY